MPRNGEFHPLREPFRDTNALTLQKSRVTGPCSFLNPTRAHYQISPSTGKETLPDKQSPELSASDEEKTASGNQDTQLASKASYQWRSRDNRKGRHTLVIAKAKNEDDANFLTPLCTNSLKSVLKNIVRMFTVFPYWDISWLIAVIFTLGSVVWVINGFFSYLPLIQPSTEFSDEVSVGGGVTAFIGAIVFFELGSILLLFESINENNTGCFGWALERLETDAITNVIPSKEDCTHHHQNKSNFVGNGKRTDESSAEYKQDLHGNESSWQWYPSWVSLRTHYFHELGFLASLAQFSGATIFGISGFTALPGIFGHLTPQWRLNVAYWIPQVVGGSGFIISGTLYMLECQEKWWKPNFKVLGWHIGFWNLIGAFGFTLCGALGMAYGNTGAQYEASLSTFWGSWAFLIGSVLQWYESLEKHPVEEGDD